MPHDNKEIRPATRKRKARKHAISLAKGSNWVADAEISQARADGASDIRPARREQSTVANSLVIRSNLEALIAT